MEHGIGLYLVRYRLKFRYTMLSHVDHVGGRGHGGAGSVPGQSQYRQEISS